MSKFVGRTQDASGVFLPAAWWKHGVHIAGRVLRKFSTTNGDCYAIQFTDPIQVDGKRESEVCIGNMAGFRMAMQAAGLDELLLGDHIYLECTGITDTHKGNPRADFLLEVERD